MFLSYVCWLTLSFLDYTSHHKKFAFAVPVTQAWRAELERKTQDAILRAMGHPVQARVGTVDSKTGERKEKMFDNLQDEKVSYSQGQPEFLEGDSYVFFMPHLLC